MNRVIKSLNNMAEFDCKNNGKAEFSVYVLDVLPLSDKCKYQLYVGSTWKTVEERFEEHKSGGPKSARIFRSIAKVGEIRWDLMNEFPKFCSRAGVGRAEARVARWLTNRGFNVRCDKLEND